jgi:hypothetical protein
MWIAALLVPVVAAAQPRPDFSRMWTLDRSQSDSTGTYGTVRLITQTEGEVNMVVLQREPYASEISGRHDRRCSLSVSPESAKQKG